MQQRPRRASRRGRCPSSCCAPTTASPRSSAAAPATARYFDERPGTYFETTGWLERGTDGGPYGLPSQTGGLGFDLAALAEKYGEDNARYILETMTRHYRRLAFIRMGVEPDGSFEERTRELAAERGWEFEALDGDLGLLRRLVDGPWDPGDFLVLQPGERAAATLGDEVIVSERSAIAGAGDRR